MADATELKTMVYSRLVTTTTENMLTECPEYTDENGHTQLHLACLDDDVERVRCLLEARAARLTNTTAAIDNVNATNKFGQTSLHLARSAAVIGLLCEAGADVRHRDSRRNTALHCVLDGRDHVGIVMTLVERGAVVDARNACGKTPLHMACIRLQHGVIAALLRHGADVNRADKFGATPLHYAVLYQDVSPDTFTDVTEWLYYMSGSRYRSMRDFVENTRTDWTEMLGPDEERIDALESPDYECIRGFSFNIGIDDKYFIDYILCRMPVVNYAERDDTPIPGESEHICVVVTLGQFLVDFNVQDGHGRTPLHVASSLGYCDIAKYLIEHGADILLRDYFGSTVLHEAAEAVHCDIFQYVCSVQVQLSMPRQEHLEYVNSQDMLKITALHKAIDVGDCLKAEALIALGSDVNIGDLTHCSPLMTAVENNIYDAVILLLDSNADVKDNDAMGNGPLHYVQFSAIRDTSRACTSDGACTELEQRADAAMRILHLLLERGAAINARNSLGQTALHDAVKSQSVEAIRILCEAGADFNIIDEYANTPLFYSGADNEDVVQILIRNKADVNARNVFGVTSLHYAAMLHYDRLTALLLASGARCNVQDVYGATPLHYLLFDKHLGVGSDSKTVDSRMIESFLKFGADCNIQTRLNLKTPLHLAYQAAHVDMKCLRPVHDRTDLNLADSLGNTPFHYASKIFNEPSLQSTSSVVNSHGMTPALYAAQAGFARLHGSIDKFSNECDRMGRNAIHLFVSNLRLVRDKGNNDVTFPHNLLMIMIEALRCGLQNKTDSLQRTFLHHFCITDAATIVDCDYVLLCNDIVEGTSVELINAQDVYGRTALFYAVLHRKWPLVDKLLSICADPMIKDNDDVLPGHIAMAFGHLGVPVLLPIDSIGVTCVELVVTPEDQHRNSLSLYKACMKLQTTLRWRTDIRRNTEVWRTLLSRACVTFNNMANCDSEFVDFKKSSVTQFVAGLLRKVADIDCRFAADPVLVGSSSEMSKLKTYIENPNTADATRDFDFMVVLRNLRNVLVVEGDQSHPNYVRFRKNSVNKADDCIHLFDADSVLQPKIVKDRIFSLIVEAMSYPEVWRDGVFEYLNAQVMNEIETPAIKLVLRFNRLIFRNKLYVSDNRLQVVHVDIVPALHTNRTLPEHTSFAEFISARNKTCCLITNNEELAILKSPRYQIGARIDELCLTTYAVLESTVIGSCPPCVVAAYRLLKYLHLCLYSRISNYALKACFVHCIVNGLFTDIENTDVVNQEGLRECLRVLIRRVWFCLCNDGVPSIARPDQHHTVWDGEPCPFFWRAYLQGFSISYSKLLMGSSSNSESVKIDERLMEVIESACFARDKTTGLSCNLRFINKDGSILPTDLIWLANDVRTLYSYFIDVEAVQLDDVNDEHVKAITRYATKYTYSRVEVFKDCINVSKTSDYSGRNSIQYRSSKR